MPTPAPLSAASVRVASSTPAALARSLASPAPAPVAKSAASGSPIPGISAGAYVPATDPRTSPNLPVRVSASPKSGCNPSVYSNPLPRINSRVGSSYSSGSNVAAPKAPVSSNPTPPRPIPLKNSPARLAIPSPSPGVADSPYVSSYDLILAVSAARTFARIRISSSTVGSSPAMVNR